MERRRKGGECPAGTLRFQAVSTAFGHVLRLARRQRGVSQEALALETGLDRTYPSLLERGLRMPTLGVLFALAYELETTATDLVQRTEAQLRGHLHEATPEAATGMLTRGVDRGLYERLDEPLREVLSASGAGEPSRGRS